MEITFVFGVEFERRSKYGSEHPGSVYRRYEGDSGKASFFISITDDKMEAYIQIFGSGHDLTLEDIVAGG